MKNKKNLKGFTLVELIVVMAVFGIIMLGAMRFLDPVSKMMKGASLQEANSAVVDNVKRYLLYVMQMPLMYMAVVTILLTKEVQL